MDPNQSKTSDNESSINISLEYSPYANQIAVYTQWYNSLDPNMQSQNYSPSQY